MNESSKMDKLIYELANKGKVNDEEMIDVFGYVNAKSISNIMKYSNRFKYQELYDILKIIANSYLPLLVSTFCINNLDIEDRQELIYILGICGKSSIVKFRLISNIYNNEEYEKYKNQIIDIIDKINNFSMKLYAASAILGINIHGKLDENVNYYFPEITDKNIKMLELLLTISPEREKYLEISYDGFLEKGKSILDYLDDDEIIDYLTMLNSCSSDMLKSYYNEKVNNTLKKNVLKLRKKRNFN